MGGLMSVTGYPDGEPLRTGISIGDYLSGFNATIAILASREMFVEVDQPVSGKVKLLGSVFKMSKTPGDRKMSAVGEYNKEIYSQLLGISAEELQKLKESGVI
jgi:crotonobetainyl-CoA:carnitine CoA-transferase CaiB-like acyl-CoA transferase